MVVLRNTRVTLSYFSIPRNPRGTFCCNRPRERIFNYQPMNTNAFQTYLSFQKKTTTKAERKELRQEYSRWREGRTKVGGLTWLSWAVRRYRKQKGRCFYCKEQVDRNTMHTDHKLPIYHGGPNHLANFVLACAECNMYKGRHMMPIRGQTTEDVLRQEKLRKIDYLSQQATFDATMHEIAEKSLNWEADDPRIKAILDNNRKWKS